MSEPTTNADSSSLERMVRRERCNQCGSEVEQQEIGMAFCMPPHPPVYVCITCKPPGTAAEIKRDFDDFMEAHDESA